MIGSKDVKIYDIIGDTVNTSKRICDQATGGELLVSDEFYKTIKEHMEVDKSRHVTKKRKKEPIKYSLF